MMMMRWGGEGGDGDAFEVMIKIGEEALWLAKIVRKGVCLFEGRLR